MKKTLEINQIAPPHYTPPPDNELLKIFPEAKGIIPEKLKEWQERKAEIRVVIKYNLKLIKNRVKDDFSRWFWREVVKMDAGDHLLECNKQIFRLNRLNRIKEGRPLSQNVLNEDTIEQAKQVSIVDVASSLVSRLRKIGRNYVGLCPFHQERHPSFYLYPDTNSFYCFGCHQGGDVIKFIELINNYSFKEAIDYLKGGR